MVAISVQKIINVRMRTEKNINKWKISDLLGSWDSALFSFYMSLWLWDYLCPKNEVIS